MERDPRILVSDDDRLVLQIARPEDGNRPLMNVSVAVAVAIALAAMAWLFRPFVSPWPMVIAWALLTTSGVLFATTEGTLVAVRSENRLLVEWRNHLTRRVRRTLDVPLSKLASFEVRSFIDTDTDVFPHPQYELLLRVNGDTAVWYTGSRESAEAVGQALLRLRPMAQSDLLPPV